MPMYWCRREPTLKDILSDSIIKAVMEADRVDARELEAMLRQVGRSSRPAPSARRWRPWFAPNRHAGDGST
jgi:hypothetical protein